MREVKETTLRWDALVLDGGKSERLKYYFL